MTGNICECVNVRVCVCVCVFYMVFDFRVWLKPHVEIPHSRQKEKEAVLSAGTAGIAPHLQYVFQEGQAPSPVCEVIGRQGHLECRENADENTVASGAATAPKSEVAAEAWGLRNQGKL